jgi:heptosyltransferase-1
MVSELANLYSRTRAARRIIVVDLGFLGDSIHLLPALWEIRRHYPEAEVHTLSAPVGAEFLRLAPCVDRPWAFPLRAPSPPWWCHWDLILELRRKRFDLALNFSGADRSIFLTALTGARWRLAHAGGRQHFWGPWLIRDWVPRRSEELPVFEQRRQILAACGYSLVAPSWQLRLPVEAKQRAEALVATGAIHFSINASTPLKEWPLRHWIELAKRLMTSDPELRIVATGSSSPREQERLHSFAGGVSIERLAVLPPGMPIADLAAILRRCRLHVGADSGVLHLAAALDVPTVAIFRDYPGTKEWLPQGFGHRHLLAPCPCANSTPPPCAPKGEALCLAQITPQRVEEVVGESARV